MMWAIELAILVVLFVVILLWPRFKYGKNAGADLYFTLLLTRSIKKSGRVPNKIPQYIFDKKLDYPYLTQYILSKFPKNFVFNYFWTIPAILNTLSIIAVYWSLAHIQGQVSLYAIIVAIAAPIYISEHNTLTSRVAGIFFYNIAFIALLFYLITKNPLFLAVMLIMLIFEFYTHKFSTQATLILLIVIMFTAIFLNDFILIGTIAMIFPILALSKTYRKFFIAHIRNIKLWCRERDSLIGKTGDFLTISFIFDRIIRNFFFNSVLLLALLTPLYPGLITNWTIIEKMSYFLLFFTATLSIVVSHLPFFSVLGEGWRYGAYLLIPLAVIFNSLAIITKAVFFLPIIILILIFDVLMQVRINRHYKYLDYVGGAVVFLKKIKNCRLHVVSGSSTLFAYMTGHKALTSVDSNCFDELCDLTIFHRKPVEHYLKKYKINTLITLKGGKEYANKDKLGSKRTKKNKCIVDTNKPAFKKVFQDKHFVIHHINLKKL